MKILMVSSEVVPYAKTGGLADVAGTLPSALKKLNLDVRVVMPKYKSIDFGMAKPLKVIDKYPINLGRKKEFCSIYEGKREDGVIFYWIENDSFFARKGLYGNERGDYKDNGIRFAFFALGAIEVIRRKLFTPDIIHIHDWQTSLIPIYLKNNLSNEKFAKIPVVLTIHNISYQGVFEKKLLSEIGLDLSLFTSEKLEFYRKLNILKGGIVFSDYITTVSPTYASEILTKDFGMGLEGVLATKKKNLTGILNGIDYTLWNPEMDRFIKYTYSKEAHGGKLLNKSYLERKLNLEKDINKPLLGMISRLAEQKGIDIFAQALPDIVEEDVQVVVLGKGDTIYEELMKSLAGKYPDKIKVNIGFDNKLAHQIYAGSDIFLMPSRFEPCGLGQMIAFKYGTVPIVHSTGGLRDTVHEFSPDTLEGNGFVFDEFSASSFLKAVKRALKVFETGKKWKKLLKNCMELDFSWEASAKKYIKLYQKLATNKN